MVLVTAAVALAVPVGVLLGLGLWTLVALVPRIGAPRLSTRIAPYVAGVSPAARDWVRRRPAEPVSVISDLLRPAGTRGRAILTTVLGGQESVERRLRQAGAASGVERFRARQLLGGAAGAIIGALLVAVLIHATSLPVVVDVGAGLVVTGTGILLPEQLLARAARARVARIADEYPTVLELLTLSLSAGESILDALRRVVRVGNGELARELGIVVADVHAGVPLADALSRCATAIGLPAFRRTVDQLVAALDRGTPLVEVLRAEARDARDETKRTLLEAAGKKEVAMLVPLVFLILPVTIAVALFPAALVLRLGF